MYHKLNNDDITDIAVNVVDEMISNGYVKNCIDTEDSEEFDVQDIIRETIVKMLGERNPHLINLDDGDIKDLLD
jgi:GTPase Era involved in 16S rRNA processing